MSILTKLRRDELLNCRQVNKFCNYFGSIILASTRTPARKMYSDKEMKDFLDTMDKRIERKTFPFTAFKISLIYIRLDLIEKFAKTVGPFVTVYSLDETSPIPFPDPFPDIGDVHHPASVPKVIALLRSSFKTLKKLSCIGVSLEDCHIPALPPIFPHLRCLGTEKVCDFKNVEDLIAHVARRSPNLELVRITGTPFPSTFEHIDLLPELLHDICCARQTPYLSLTFSPTDATVLTELCRRKYSRLRSLSISIGCQNMQLIITSLNTLLLLQAESIEVLEIKLDLLGAQLNPDLSVVIPQLENLGTLAIIITNPADFFPVPQLMMPSNFLKLTSLDLGSYNGEIRWLDESVVIPTVTTLSVDYVGSANEESFHKNFPNLKKLKTTSSSFGFKVYIFTQMKGLEVLRLGVTRGECGHDAIWSVFTGGSQKLTKDEIIQLFKEVCTHKTTLNV